MHKRTIILVALTAAIFIGTAAITPPEEKEKRNLKVLPKDISHDELDAIMHQFNDALGVKCNHCHAGAQVDGRLKLNFASDEKPEKEMAREMLRMTEKINKKFFGFKGEGTPSVSCMTCHNGNAHPK
jgi:hypothetical protein